VWESSLENVMHSFTGISRLSSGLQSGKYPGEVSTTWLTSAGMPSHGLPTQYALWFGGFSPIHAFLQIEDQLRFGDIFPCSCKTMWDFVKWLSQDFSRLSLSARMDMFGTCAVTKEAASHSDYQTL
jgi:hypothetical protein